MTQSNGVVETRNVSLAGARQVLDAALHRAEELTCTNLAIVVLDTGGDVITMARHDGVSGTVTRVAKDKANTALTMGVATEGFADAVKGDPMLVAGLSAQDGIALLAGGTPLRYGDGVVGAVGVAGATDGSDPVVAEAGAAALST